MVLRSPAWPVFFTNFAKIRRWNVNNCVTRVLSFASDNLLKEIFRNVACGKNYEKCLLLV